MRSKLRRSIVVGFLCLTVAAVSPATRAVAHPHAWIDITVDVIFDEEGRVTGLHQKWLFDPAYTIFATEGLDGDGDGAPDKEKLKALLRENLRNLKEYRYFTRVLSAAGPVAFSGVSAESSRMAGQRLEMEFTVQFQVPVDAAAAPLEYAIYDPTYYIEMVHAEGAAPIRLVHAPAGCRHALRQPNPNPEVVSLAASLDRTESAGDGLGRFFAETVAIECGAAR